MVCRWTATVAFFWPIFIHRQRSFLSSSYLGGATRIVTISHSSANLIAPFLSTVEIAHVMKLSRSFFTRPTLEVAPDLLGTTLVHKTESGEIRGMVTEVEAYTGTDDPASHSFKGQTKRNQSMWLEGGHAYIFLIYGIHYCFNVTTEQRGQPGAVLVRSVALETKQGRQIITGPGNVAKAFGLTFDQQGMDCVTSDVLFFEERKTNDLQFEATPRIGISKATDFPWRFTVSDKMTDV